MLTESPLAVGEGFLYPERTVENLEPPWKLALRLFPALYTILFSFSVLPYLITLLHNSTYLNAHPFDTS